MKNISIASSLMKGLSSCRTRISHIAKLAIWMIVLLLPPAQATNIENVNVGRVEVADQSSNSQREAGKLALKQVFIKLSGDPQIADNDPVARAIDNYEQFLISSSFIQNDNALILEASFNQQKIESLLLASNLNVWTSLRPSAVLWLAVEYEGDNAFILTQNSATSLNEVLVKHSFARGVQIIVPIGDLQDQINVSLFDVANQFVSRLKESSQRYASDLLISASLQAFDAKAAIEAQAEMTASKTQFVEAANRQEVDNQNIQSFQSSQASMENELVQAELANNQDIQEELDEGVNYNPIPENAKFKLDFVITSASFTQRNGVKTGSLYAEEVEDLLKQLVDVYADNLAREYSLNTQGPQVVSAALVEVSNIKSLQDYVSLIQLISNIPAVNNVRLIEQKADSATINIELNISVQQLSSIMALDDRLTINKRTQIDSEFVSFIWRQ